MGAPTCVADETCWNVDLSRCSDGINHCPGRPATNHHGLSICRERHAVVTKVDQHGPVFDRQPAHRVATAPNRYADLVHRAGVHHSGHIGGTVARHNAVRPPINRTVPHRPSSVVCGVSSSDDCDPTTQPSQGRHETATRGDQQPSLTHPHKLQKSHEVHSDDAPMSRSSSESSSCDQQANRERS